MKTDFSVDWAYNGESSSNHKRGNFDKREMDSVYSKKVKLEPCIEKDLFHKPQVQLNRF
jgi:hypothetical protein